MASAPSLAAAEPVHVQIRTIPLAAVSTKGYRGRTTVTPYMTVTDEAAFERLCARLPALLDVLAQVFEEQPIELSDTEVDLSARQDDLRNAVEGALGVRLYEALYIVQGGRRPGELTETIKLPGSSRDCQAIAYLPWQAPANASPQAPAPMPTLNKLAAQLPSDDPMAPEAHLSDAELERLLEAELAGVFPNEPARPEGMPVMGVALIVFAVTGVLLMVGSYIGYQVGRMRRDRRRKDRRKRKKERRTGLERRELDKGPPPGLPDRRSGKDRREVGDRRKAHRRMGPRQGED